MSIIIIYINLFLNRKSDYNKTYIRIIPKMTIIGCNKCETSEVNNDHLDPI